jgi:hypothetical protein
MTNGARSQTHTLSRLHLASLSVHSQARVLPNTAAQLIEPTCTMAYLPHGSIHRVFAPNTGNYQPLLYHGTVYNWPGADRAKRGIIHTLWRRPRMGLELAFLLLS